MVNFKQRVVDFFMSNRIETCSACSNDTPYASMFDVKYRHRDGTDTMRVCSTCVEFLEDMNREREMLMQEAHEDG
jgi:hypothetical protein